MPNLRGTLHRLIVLLGSQCGSSGVFWLNAAETWIDIAKRDTQNMVSSLVSLVSGTPKETPQVDAHFMSESGIVDTFFFLGPEPYDVFRQYVKLTGSSPLPPVSFYPKLWTTLVALFL